MIACSDCVEKLKSQRQSKEIYINGECCPFCHSNYHVQEDFESSVKVYRNEDSKKQIKDSLKVSCEKHPEQFVSKFCSRH